MTAPQFLLALAMRAGSAVSGDLTASDDLHAMRAEMEDSSISKRTVRQTGSDKTSSWLDRLQGPAAMVASAELASVLEVRVFEGSVPHVSLRCRGRAFSTRAEHSFSLPG